MNIAFANQKGGVGKTALLLLLADYLNEKKEKPLCLDFDVRGSLTGKWMAANSVSTEGPTPTVIQCDLDNFEHLKEDMDFGKTEVFDHYLFDLPENLENASLQLLLETMDLIICPFLYEVFSFESTLMFSQIILDLELKAQIVLIPKLVKANVRYDIRENVDNELSKLGKVTPMIKDWVDMQSLDFFNISDKQRDGVREAFDFIANNYLLIK